MPHRSTSSAEQPPNHLEVPLYPHPSSSPRPPVRPSPSQARVSVSSPDGGDTRNYVSVSEPAGRHQQGDSQTTTLRSFADLCRSVSLLDVLARCLHSRTETKRHSPVSGGSFSKITFCDPTAFSPPTALNIDRSSFALPPWDDTVRCNCAARGG